jgi:hypothetical protein
MRKARRYGAVPNLVGIDGAALYWIERREACKKRYKKPGHKALSQRIRESLIEVKT